MSATQARPRLFVALMLEPELGAAVFHAVEPALAGAELRRHAPGELHLTLFFLGATGTDVAERLKVDLAAVAARHTALDLRLTRAGAFPEPGRERVLWIGVDERRAGPLVALQADVEAVCVAAGATREPRTWRPHVTVARRRDEKVGGNAASVPAQFYDTNLDLEWKPKRLQLVESVAGRERAEFVRERYRVVADFALATR
ncbi:MAG: RNA 2',3'-cyclic phosphodiesterase [Planctomycetes bacterium]|nr:RNA 2',3'-cyclic phosphodiesterase [Planctomycetota bacterium]